MAGLGNPGRRYRDTRHNAGFLIIDEISRITGIKVRGFKYRGRVGSGSYQNQRLILLKPRTYMNLSGQSVRACLKGLKIPPASLIVIHDDLDLPAGRVRVKRGGGHGGHRGILSIIENLGERDFVRIKVGIGKPALDDDPADYVLTPFSPEELGPINQAIEKGALAALAVAISGVDAAMNEFNSK